MISPYFVPGEEVTASWVKSVEAGKRVRVLTNSLIANDVAAVHGGYARYRETAGGGRCAGLGVEADCGQRRAVEPVRLIGRQPPHEVARGGRPDTLRRQLQPRPALDLAQLRAGCDRGKPGARAAARGDLRRADGATTRLAGDAGATTSSAGATGPRPSTAIPRPPPGSASRRGSRASCTSTPSCSGPAIIAGSGPTPISSRPRARESARRRACRRGSTCRCC